MLNDSDALALHDLLESAGWRMIVVELGARRARALAALISTDDLNLVKGLQAQIKEIDHLISWPKHEAKRLQVGPQ